MKVIAKYFEIIYYVFYPVFILTFIQPIDEEISTRLIGFGIVTTALSIGVIAVFFQEKSKKALVFKFIMAFSRSCMTVKLDKKTGRILPTKNVIEQVAAHR